MYKIQRGRAFVAPLVVVRCRRRVDPSWRRSAPLLLAPSALYGKPVCVFFSFSKMFSYTHNHARRSVMANVNYFHVHSHTHAKTHARKHSCQQAVCHVGLQIDHEPSARLYSSLLKSPGGDAQYMLIFINAPRDVQSTISLGSIRVPD